MRTFFPPTSDESSARKSLTKALVLSLFLVAIWVLLSLMPDPELPPVGARPALTEATSAQSTAAALNTSWSASSAGSTADTVPPGAEPQPQNAEGRTPLSGRVVPATGGQLVSDSPSLISPGYIFALLLLIGGGIMAMRLRKSSPHAAAFGLKELGRLSIGTSQSVQLVACADEILLLGSGPGGLTLLKSYPAASFPVDVQPEAVAAATQESNASADTAASAAHDPESGDNPGAPDFAPEDLEWTVSGRERLGQGPDFLTLLRRYADRKTYRSTPLTPPAKAESSN